MAEDNLLSGILGMGSQSLMYQYPQLAGPMRQQMFGQALMEQGMQTSPVRSPWQAAARAVQGALGGWEMGRGGQNLLAIAQQNAARMGDFYRGLPSPYEIDPSLAGGAQTGTAQPPTAPQAANVPTAMAPLFAAADQKHGFPPGTTAAVANWETRGSFDPNARGPQVGSDPNNRAGGVMQIMPDTAGNPGFGVASISDADRFDPTKAIPMAAEYLNARGKARFHEQWNPKDPAQLSAALTDYSGGYPADQYANPIMARINAGQPITAASNVTTPGGDDVAANFGARMFQVYREEAARAASSLDPRMQALAPHLMDQALQALQYGRFSTMLSPQGEWVIRDRFGAEKDQSPSEQQMDQLTRNWLVQESRRMAGGAAEDPRYAAMWQRANTPQLVDNPAGGKTPVYPPPIPNVIPPRGGPVTGPTGGPAGAGVLPGEATMPSIDVGAARSEGVPVYQNPSWRSLPTKEGAAAANKNVDEGNTWLQGQQPQLQKARDTLQVIDRLSQLARMIPTGDDLQSRTAREAMTLGGDSNLSEFRQLSEKLIGDSRANEGINRISEPALELLGKLAPNEKMQPQALQNALAAYRAREQLALQHGMFLETYIPRNYGRTGAEPAWDRYLDANPIVQQDKDGNITPSRMVPWQQWFQRNMDPTTGALTAGGFVDKQPTTVGTVYIDDKTGKRMKVTPTGPVPVD